MDDCRRSCHIEVFMAKIVSTPLRPLYKDKMAWLLDVVF